LKIIQVLNHFLPYQTAGTEVYTWALSKELRSKGIEVSVLIPNYGEYIDNEYEYDGLLVHQFAEPTVVDRNLIMGFRKPEGLNAFRSYLELVKPDIVHFHELAGSNGIGINHVRIAKKCGVKVIMTFHLASNTCATGTLIYKGKTPCDGKISIFKCSTCYLHKRGLNKTSNLIAWISTALNRFNLDTSKLNHPIGTLFGTTNIIKRLEQNFVELIENCDQVVCITKWYHQELQLNGINLNKITYIEQGLPTSFSVNRVPEYRNLKPIKLMFLGRISPFKGLHLLIQALESFSESDFELSIFGSSDDRTVYQSKLIKKTIGKDNIHWKGILDQSKVHEEMCQHDILCLCSTFSEMSPLVIQEARAACLPVLASNVNGNKEQMENGASGLLFEMNNVESLKKQLFKIRENRNLLNEMKTKILSPRVFMDVAIEYMKLYKKIKSEA
jgi:glycosyltransferase involved in cell wall biosynthesis